MTTAAIQPDLGLVAGWADLEGGWGPQMNANLILLDGIVFLAVNTSGLNAPPTSPLPIQGDRHIVGTAPTGAWANSANKVAYFNGVSWTMFTPRAGWRALNKASSTYKRFQYFDGTAWGDEPVGDDPAFILAVNNELTDHETRIQTLEATATSNASALTAVNTTLTQINQTLAAVTNLPVQTFNDTGYTLTMSDGNKYLVYKGLTTGVVTIPNNTDVALPIGTQVVVRHNGNDTGVLTFAGATGVTVNKPYGGSLQAAGVGATVTLFKVGTNEWDVGGQVAYSTTAATNDTQILKPSDGFSFVMDSNKPNLIIASANNLTSGAVRLPPTPYSSMVCVISSTKDITNLSILPNTGQVMGYTPLGIKAGGRIAFRYTTTQKTWYPA